MNRGARRAFTLPIALFVITVLVLSARPVPSQNSIYPVQHVVIIMEENHSFDNYFGTFPGVNGYANAPSIAQQKMHDMTKATHDLCHTAGCIQSDYNGGLMNGYNDSEQFGYYNANTIPYYWQLAKQYTLMDSYFSGFLGPSLPNRVVSISGSNYGGTTNQVGYDGQRLNATIFDILNTAGISWKYYTGYSDSFNGFNPLPLTSSRHKATDYQLFQKDVTSHNLPQVSWLMPQTDDTSEHPPYNVTVGMDFVRSAIATVQKSNYWSSTVILMTWDESGGYYDHVAPPSASYGIRVPMIVVSPFAFKGFVDHTFSSHLSTLALIERLFNLPCMKLDCGANDLLDTLNFGHKDISRLMDASPWVGPLLDVAGPLGMPRLASPPE